MKRVALHLSAAALLALATGMVPASARAESKRDRASQEKASEEFLRQADPSIAAYAKAVEEYARNPSPESPWYTTRTAVENITVGAGPTFDDQQIRSALDECIRNMESFRNTHEFVRTQAAELISKRKGPLLDIDRLALTTLTMTLTQQFTKWKKPHDVIVPLLRKRLGRVVPEVTPPPYLLQLRDLIRPAAQASPAPKK